MLFPATEDAVARAPSSGCHVLPGGMLSTAKTSAVLLIGVSRSKKDGGLLTADRWRDAPSRRPVEAVLRPEGRRLRTRHRHQRLPERSSFVANNGSHESYNALILGCSRTDAGFVVLTNSGTGIGVELELGLSFFEDVIGERPVIARDFARFRTALRWGTIVALLLCLLFLWRVVRAVRRATARGRASCR